MSNHRPSNPRKLVGMSYAQSEVFRRIKRLEREVCELLSLFASTDDTSEVTAKMAEMENLIAVHFPEDWDRMQARALIREVGGDCGETEPAAAARDEVKSLSTAAR